MAQAWSPRTRGVLLASPSNPTGTSIDPDEMGRIVAAVRARGGIALAWLEDNPNELIDEFIGIVRGRTAQSSRTAAARASRQEKAVGGVSSRGGAAAKTARGASGRPRRGRRR